MAFRQPDFPLHEPVNSSYILDPLASQWYCVAVKACYEGRIYTEKGTFNAIMICTVIASMLGLHLLVYRNSSQQGLDGSGALMR